MIGASLYNLLSAHAPLVALVGDQIYPVQAPQEKEDPVVIYGIVSQKGEHDKSRLSTEDWIEVEVLVYSKDYDKLHQICKEVRAALDGQNGTIEGNEISQISFVEFKDGWEPERESYAGDTTYQVISSP